MVPSIRTRSSILVLLASLACDPQNSVECGEGTVEVDGRCVVDGGTSGASTANNGTPSKMDDRRPGDSNNDEDDGGADDGGEIGDDGDEIGDDGEADDGSTGEDTAGEPLYGPCPGMSDLECVQDAFRDEFCSSAINGCSAECLDDTDCGAVSDGTAVPRCERVSVGGFDEFEMCVLGCHANLVCPEGMECGSVEGEYERLQVCVWP